MDISAETDISALFILVHTLFSRICSMRDFIDVSTVKISGSCTRQSRKGSYILLMKIYKCSHVFTFR